LPGAKHFFDCDRENWQKYYQSTMVFPIRYPINSQEDEFLYVGFLAFDAPRPNAFRGVPDVFKFNHDPDGYAALLDKSAAFHLGAVFADMLGSILGPPYESYAPKHEASNVSK
jgi:hypothetical protein